MTLHIEYRDIDTIRPHPENPKGHELDELVDSVKRFGWTDPLLECGRTGLLAAGHGRLEMVLRERAGDRPPPNGVEVVDGTWQLPVVLGWQSADDTELKAYLVADNAIGPRGGWVQQALHDILSELGDSERGFVGIGMGLDELETITAELGLAELPHLDTAAAYADRPERNEPVAPRQVQGLHEVGLMFKHEQLEAFNRALATLRAQWGHDLPTPDVVLRAMTAVAGTT
jgi:hypothetical protein